ncbi:MAG: phosphate acetyltransferase [Phycisphaerae bacterium]|nr:phosphate acetyltransferase [Phycisphaerae bacterium]
MTKENAAAKQSIIEIFTDKIKGRNLSVVLPEGRDPRIIEAAHQIKEAGIAVPIILGKSEQVEAAAQEAGIDLAGMTVIDPRDSDRLDDYAAMYVGDREDISQGVARRMVSKAVFFGGMMVKAGDADVMVAGAASATATVIQAGSLTVGLASGIDTVSSYFLMIIPEFQGETDKPFIYADCAVNIDPTAEQLADIAMASGQSAKCLLTDTPRVAMLSYSTRGSAAGPSAEKVLDALRIVREKAPQLAVDGEFQADSAIIARVAAKKVKDESAVAGQANVLIFPDLDAGNIAYKLTQYMANAKAIGPFLQGFAKPIADLSRGASVSDIVTTSIITLALVPSAD